MIELKKYRATAFLSTIVFLILGVACIVITQEGSTTITNILLHIGSIIFIFAGVFSLGLNIHLTQKISELETEFNL